MERKRVAILGGGPAGLALAGSLAGVEGLEIDLVEKSARIGGLQHSVECEGLHFDIGTFLYFDNHGLFNAFPQIKPLFVPITYTPTSIFPSGKIGAYPFTVRQFLNDNGLLAAIRAGIDLCASKLICHRDTSASEFARYYIGDTIYQRSGLANYIHRLHDVSGDEIDAKFARERMPFLSRLSLRKMLRKLLPGTTPRVKTNQYYVRPAEGIPAVYGPILNELKSRGVNVLLGSELKSIRRQGSGFVVEGNHTGFYDKIVSTIPISDMLALIGLKPETNIESRGLISLFYRGEISPQSSILFNFSFEGAWKRVTVFSRFYGPAENGDDYFTVEITSDDFTLENIERLRLEFEKESLRHNICEKAPRFLNYYLTRHAYPVFRRGGTPGVEREKQRIVDFGIELLGRQGNFEYQISDWVAKRAVEKGKELAGFFRR